MTNILSLSEYEDIWKNNSDNAYTPDVLDNFDIIYPCPPNLGQGYERWIELPEIDLLIINEEFCTDINIEFESDENYEIIEFGFNLTGTWHRPDNISFFDWNLGHGETIKDKYLKVLSRDNLLKVDIHLHTCEVLNRFLPDNLQQLPLELNNLINRVDKHECSHVDIINPAMKLSLIQMINCPFQGLTKRIYLESKCLELISLKLEQILAGKPKKKQNITFKSEDIEQIHLARKILLDNYKNPPSLLDLARLVKLNDRKLKQGFHYCFGTTVFGYLYEHRMIEAEKLLRSGRMNINEVARAVGYTSRSAFYTAFRKKFGVSPQNYF